MYNEFSAFLKGFDQIIMRTFKDLPVWGEFAFDDNGFIGFIPYGQSKAFFRPYGVPMNAGCAE